MLQTGLIVGHARRSKMERIMPTHFELVADVLSEVCVCMASRHLFSRLDAVQSLFGPMQPGQHTLWSIDSQENYQNWCHSDFISKMHQPQTPLGSLLHALLRPPSCIRLLHGRERGREVWSGKEGEVLSPPIGDSRSNGGEGRRARRGSWVGASRHHLNFPR